MNQPIITGEYGAVVELSVNAAGLVVLAASSRDGTRPGRVRLLPAEADQLAAIRARRDGTVIA